MNLEEGQQDKDHSSFLYFTPKTNENENTEIRDVVVDTSLPGIMKSL